MIYNLISQLCIVVALVKAKPEPRDAYFTGNNTPGRDLVGVVDPQAYGTVYTPTHDAEESDLNPGLPRSINPLALIFGGR